MASTLVTIERLNSVAIVRFNRYQELNTLLPELLDELGYALTDLLDDASVRAVILSCARDGVSSKGLEIAELTAIDEGAASDWSHRTHGLFDQIEKSVVPVIAAVSGVLAGDGLELALACHMRVASRDVEFRLPGAEIGMPPLSVVTQKLARITAGRRALDIPLNGRKLSAEEALRIGLVNHVTDPDSLMSKTEELASEISKLAPLAIRACLEAVTRGLELSLQEGLTIEAELFSRLFATDDVREGTRAFLEKRAPSFKGR